MIRKIRSAAGRSFHLYDKYDQTISGEQCGGEIENKWHQKNLFYCNRDGLFSVVPMKGIDDKQTSYDDSGDREALEQAAKILLG